MTAPINTPTTGAAKDAASARKRRRRAPAGGAADDCFTCAKRNVKCDRRRPYCSQCLEIGNECSGYKTQLTWGVGVASRGKLRGLSLPIAKAPPVNNGKASISTLKSPTTTARSRTTSIVSAGGHWGSEQDERAREEMEMGHGHGHERSPSVPVSPFHPYDMSHMSPSEPAPPGWTHIPFSSSMAANDGPRFPPPRPLHINVSMPGDMMHRELIHTPIDTMNDVDYMSPIAHSFPREEVPQYLHSPLVYEGSHGYGSPIAHSPPTGIMIEPPRAPTSCPGLVYGSSEPASSLQSHMSNVESLEAQLSRQLPHDRDALVPGTPDLDTYSTSAQSHGPFWASSTDEESVSQSVTERSQGTWPSSFHSQSPSPVLQVNSDLISKMPFFMDYYEKTMCPSMVFIDGPNNPFREHILRLGANSRSLQHAICALAACNLRMKRKLSLGHHAMEAGEKRLDGSPIDSPLDSQPRDQSLVEEYQHRNLAVRLLDEQLNDPEKSLHDSVLATILLLCHYRMAESGIAKFHTQFAGVKKILGMRRMSPYPPSRDSAWMEALFTYFDAISASVNDREAQLNTSFYGVLPDALLLPPGAENLVGCDRELFRIIIKLGRLNLLSQHRPVQNLLASSPLPRANAHSSRSVSPLGASFKTSPLLGRPDHHHHHTLFGGLPHPINSSVRFDGNGFGSALEDDDMLSTSPFHNPTTFEDQRNTFWREWKEARISLQGWKFDAERVRASLTGPPPNSPSSPPSSMSMGMGIGVGAGGTTPPPTSTQIDDLCSLSEAFRYAALLYTERLAYPNFPSNRDNFRNLVTQVVYWATSLQAGSSAEKFLLWPLFVAGSECVNELQQNIVRNKCREIMARSGYMNNLAALDVLERLWAGDMNKNGSSSLDDRSSKHHSLVPPRGGPFNWIKLTGSSSEVEWIMF